MIFRPFYYFDLGCAAYLFGCGSLGRCAVVDARADDIEAYLSFAAQKGMRITHVIQAFIDALANVPEKPADMARILAFNRGVAEVRAGA